MGILNPMSEEDDSLHLQSIEEAEAMILHFIQLADPYGADTISVDLNAHKVTVVVLGLSRLVEDDNLPMTIRKMCALLVAQFTATIEVQKSPGLGGWIENG